MALLFSEHNSRRHLEEPPFTRMRHRYLGPRESEKINLEINQLHFSVAELAGRFHASYLLYRQASDLFYGDVVERDDITRPEPVLDEDGYQIVAFPNGDPIFDIDDNQLVPGHALYEQALEEGFGYYEYVPVAIDGMESIAGRLARLDARITNIEEQQ